MTQRAALCTASSPFYSIPMTRHATKLLSLLVALASRSWAFQQVRPALVQWTKVQPATISTVCQPFSLRSSASDDDKSQESELTDSSDVPPPPQVVSSVTRQPRQRSSLDPLVASLTRMDDETLQAKRTNIPLWGELILDKSLMVFLPVVAFAVIGVGMSIYVILNSQDAIVDALMDASSPEYLKGVADPTISNDPSACRGLCGSQQDDLEALRGFMAGFGK